MNIHFFRSYGTLFNQLYFSTNLSNLLNQQNQREINPTDCIVIRSSFLAMTVKTNPHLQNSAASLSNLAHSLRFIAKIAPSFLANFFRKFVVYIPKALILIFWSASSEPSKNIPKPPLITSPNQPYRLHCE